MTLHSVTDLDQLWLRTLEELGDLAAHEIKDTLNGVSLSLEVVRSRSGNASSVSDFAATAAGQLELVTARVDAMLVLARRPKEPADISATLRRLASVLVPAAKAEGGTLNIEGIEGSTLTSAPGQASRLALTASLLALIRMGGEGSCRLEGGSRTAVSEGGAVVHFSHESAETCSLDPDVVSAIEQHEIRLGTGGPDLRLAFPAYR